jgi:hypothetical protein
MTPSGRARANFPTTAGSAMRVGLASGSARSPAAKVWAARRSLPQPGQTRSRMPGWQVSGRGGAIRTLGLLNPISSRVRAQSRLSCVRGVSWGPSCVPICHWVMGTNGGMRSLTKGEFDGADEVHCLLEGIEVGWRNERRSAVRHQANDGHVASDSHVSPQLNSSANPLQHDAMPASYAGCPTSHELVRGGDLGSY